MIDLHKIQIQLLVFLCTITGYKTVNYNQLKNKRHIFDTSWPWEDGSEFRGESLRHVCSRFPLNTTRPSCDDDGGSWNGITILSLWWTIHPLCKAPLPSSSGDCALVAKFRAMGVIWLEGERAWLAGSMQSASLVILTPSSSSGTATEGITTW